MKMGLQDCSPFFLKGVYDMSEFGVEQAREYLFQMQSAVGTRLGNTQWIYGGREGHLRFARECGFALNDFDTSGQKEIMMNSYSTIYVTGCDLKPILSAKEWKAGLISGKKGMNIDEVEERAHKAATGAGIYGG